MTDCGELTIGILALQGAFAEHEAMLQTLSTVCDRSLIPILVRTPAELDACDALIIPGGESTTISLLIRLSALYDPLRRFIAEKPVWGTCAGAILLATACTGAKRGGQQQLGGIDVTIARNGWGGQLESFEAPLDLKGDAGFNGIFIRAPVILSLTPVKGSPPIEVISRLPEELLPPAENPGSSLPTPLDLDGGAPSYFEIPPCEPDPRTIVALRQGRHMMTTFHPELTRDARFHEYFVRQCVLGAA